MSKGELTNVVATKGGLMIRIILDSPLADQFHNLHEPLELCDSSGRVLAMAMPVADISECEPISPGISAVELRSRASSPEKRQSTQEVIEHLGRLGCSQ